MFDRAIVGERHTRTIVKAACYRVISTFVTFALTLILGGNALQALTMSMVVVAVGSLHYYLYDRIWLWISWQRNREGEDSAQRSLVKSVVYRITALVITAALARVVFADTTMIALALASIKFLVNIAAYYVLERLFNRISWGRKI